MYSATKLTTVCATIAFTMLLSACGGGSDGSSAATTTGTSSTASGNTSTATAPAVTQTATANSVAISWTPPTQNVDGSVLSDLDAYKIYYGTSPDNLSDSIRVEANVTSYMMSGLISGTTYYFAITSLNTVGTESDLSNVASKSV